MIVIKIHKNTRVSFLRILKEYDFRFGMQTRNELQKRIERSVAVTVMFQKRKEYCKYFF